MAIVTVDGLEDVPATQTATPAAQWAAAGGAADAITAAYPTPNLALTDGLPLAFRAASTNVTATPTFAPDGLTAHAITKKGGLALKASDIRQNGEYLVRYNLANTRWELYNEAPRDVVFDWVASGGTADRIAAGSPPISTLSPTPSSRSRPSPRCLTDRPKSPASPTRASRRPTVSPAWRGS